MDSPLEHVVREGSDTVITRTASVSGRWLRPLAPLLLLALVSASCGGTAQREEVEFRVPVTVRDVGTGAVEDRIVATGTLRAEEVVTLRAETSGILIAARSNDRRDHR